MDFLREIDLFSGQAEIQFPSFWLNPDRMKRITRKSISVAALAVMTALTIGTSFGQAARVIAEKPTFDDLPSPQFSGAGKDKGFKPKNWLEIEVKLKVSLAPIPASKTCDRITVKWYLAVKDPDKAGKMLLFSKDVDYVNIPLDEDVFCSVYLSPASLRRITGSDRAGKNAVDYVGYEVMVNGEKKAEESSKGKAGWWNTESDKISRSEAVPLLNKMETPFADMWWDRYAEVSVERK